MSLPSFELRRCSACRRLKFLGDSVRNRTARGGFGAYCKPCHNLIGRRNQQVDDHRDDHRGRCAICRSAPAEQVDHDHETRLVRGIVCGRCDGGPGPLKEDPEIIRGAIAYLEKWSNAPDIVREPATSYILSVA